MITIALLVLAMALCRLGVVGLKFLAEWDSLPMDMNSSLEDLAEENRQLGQKTSRKK